MASKYENFIKFPVASTNIFPLVNSTQGGQLVTEFNLKSRDMVSTNPDIKYAQGSSFVHSSDDFAVSVSTTSSSILQVAPGRAVINGHYFESLTPVEIDLVEMNVLRQQSAKPALIGNLSIGFKTYFSTQSTMSGAMRSESGDMYIGVQLVIAKTSDFKTPDDSPTDRDAVVADLKLADFTYVNGVVSSASIAPNPNVTRYIPSERIIDFDNIIDSKYVTTTNTQNDTLYTFSGKSKDWCRSTDSLMIWDTNPEDRKVPESQFSTVGEAQFITLNDAVGNVCLAVPHKQVDGGMVNAANDTTYFYADKYYPLPIADYDSKSSGIVTKAYTERILQVENAITTYKQFTNGKQIDYHDSLRFNSSTQLYDVDGQGTWDYSFPVAQKYNVGDYVLIREDYTLSASSTMESSAPSTMYIVVPGGVLGLDPNSLTTTRPSGLRLGSLVTWYAAEFPNPPSSTSPTADELKEIFEYNNYIGTTNDYFEIEYRITDDTEGTSYFYPVTSVAPYGWSKPLKITGTPMLATTEQIGGFYNAPSTATDAGYVILDSTGHLRLLDYALLRSGLNAYQLGEDYTMPKNKTLDVIQSNLDEYVNDRIAFPFNVSMTVNSPMIDVTIPLTADSDGTINIHNIDSRFGTGVYLHFIAEDTTQDFSNIIINIYDCEKIRIDSSISTWASGPMINIIRCCLYYDASVMNYIRTCGTRNNFTGFEDLTLWYSKFSDTDPEIAVNGMEVSQPDVVVVENIDFWSSATPADNHYKYALRSITFSNSGSIIGCSLYVGNNSTAPSQVDTTHSIIIGGEFNLPNGPALKYPAGCLDNALQVTGTFPMAYEDSTHTKWITMLTTFTATSGAYNAGVVSNGYISFITKTELIDKIYTNVVPGWEPGNYHIFYGGTTV